MRAAFENAAEFHHQDLVRVDHRGQAVRDDQCGLVARRALQFGLDGSVRAMATRCFSPPESFNPRSPTACTSGFAPGASAISRFSPSNANIFFMSIIDCLNSR